MRFSVLFTLQDAWRMRRAWWFTATARTRARFGHLLKLIRFFQLLSIAALALVYGTVFKVQDFNTYVVYLGIGQWCGMELVQQLVLLTCSSIIILRFITQI